MGTKGQKPHEELTWYSAMVSFESVEPTHGRADLVFEIRVMVFKADTEGHARQKAKRLAISEEHSYSSISGERVTWKFREVLDICCLSWVSKFGEGDEVYFKILNSAGLAELKRWLARKIHDG